MIINFLLLYHHDEKTDGIISKIQSIHSCRCNYVFGDGDIDWSSGFGNQYDEIEAV